MLAVKQLKLAAFVQKSIEADGHASIKDLSTSVVTTDNFLTWLNSALMRITQQIDQEPAQSKAAPATTKKDSHQDRSKGKADKQQGQQDKHHCKQGSSNDKRHGKHHSGGKDKLRDTLKSGTSSKDNNKKDASSRNHSSEQARDSNPR